MLPLSRETFLENLPRRSKPHWRSCDRRKKCGCGPLVGHQPSKLCNRVRFPASAPIRVCPSTWRPRSAEGTAGAMCWIRKALVQRAHQAAHAPLPASGHSRIGDTTAPVTKLVDVPESDSEFWEFESPLGHQPSHLQSPEEGRPTRETRLARTRGAHAPVSALLRALNCPRSSAGSIFRNVAFSQYLH